MICLTYGFRRALINQGFSPLIDGLNGVKQFASAAWLCSVPDAKSQQFSSWHHLSSSTAQAQTPAAALSVLLQQPGSYVHAHGLHTASSTMQRPMHRAMSSTHRFTDDYDKHHRVNDAIFRSQLQVIFPDGHTELLTRKDALKAAAEQKLDLVEFLGPESQGPAVAKVTNYKSLRIQHSKSRQEELKRIRESISATVQGAGSSKVTQEAAPAPGKRAPVRAAATEAGGAGTVGRQQQGGDRGKGDVRRKQASEEKKEGKPKVKEVTFSPKIATRDIEVRMKRIRGWLDDGARVSLIREVDAKDSEEAAMLALDSLVAQLADVAVPVGAKRKTGGNVSIMIQPKGAQAQQAAAKKQKKAALKAAQAEKEDSTPAQEQ